MTEQNATLVGEQEPVSYECCELYGEYCYPCNVQAEIEEA